MPHLILEYSSNLEPRIDMGQLVSDMHKAAAAIDALPLAGLRTRAYPCEHYQIADGHLENGFIAAYLRIGEGRTLEQRQIIGETLARSLNDCVAAHYAKFPLAVSFEVQEIETNLRWNTNNLRDYLAERNHV